MARRKLRIATFNVNGIRPRLSHLLQWLAKEKPDVACLQELKASDAQFPAAEIEAAGYGALWVGQPSWNGVAVSNRPGLSRRVAASTEIGHFPVPARTRDGPLKHGISDFQ